MNLFLLATAVVCLGVGLSVWLANPDRFPNQVFSVLSLVVFAISLLVYGAFNAGPPHGLKATNPVPWVRWAAALTSCLPWILWILKESFFAGENEKKQTLRRSLPLFAVAIIAAGVCLTDWYIPLHSPRENPQRGAAYAPRNIVVMGMFVFVGIQAWLQTKKQTGIRRIELQFFVLNLVVGILASLSLSIANQILRMPVLRIFSLMLISLGFLAAAWAIAYYRIFNLRQVLGSLAQRAGLVLLLGVAVVYAEKGLGTLIPRSGALVLSAAGIISVGFWLDRKTRRWLDLDGDRTLANTRESVVAIARTEPRSARLIAEFESLLRAQNTTSFAALLFERSELKPSTRLEFSNIHPGHDALCEAGWATPERLERQRFSSGAGDLNTFMAKHSLGLMVTVPPGSRSPSLILALGTKNPRWPYTYPEVERLQNIAELMDNILTRSRLTTQAALSARVEHLAIMSRGLAHDLKNLITPISSYLVHTENNFSPAGPEAEVHSAARRSVRIMTDYIREALFFSQRLSPDFATVDIAKLFSEVHATTLKRAGDRNVTVVFDSTGISTLSLVADAVLLQRLLANLVVNAIDASLSGQTVQVSASAGRSGWVKLIVSDQGCGISPVNLSRIFDPYFTTKEFGDDVRGFGLGLTICQKIAHLHAGTISVASQSQRGTTITVELPANPVPAAASSSPPTSRE